MADHAQSIDETTPRRRSLDDNNEVSAASSYYLLYTREKGNNDPIPRSNDRNHIATTSSSDNVAPAPPRDAAGGAAAALAGNETSDGPKGDGGESTPGEDDGVGFWVEDEWSADQTAQAEEVLRNAESSCNVATSSPRGPYLIERYERDACKNWDAFYERNGTNFFKDRHYLHRAFPEEFGPLHREETDEDTDETGLAMKDVDFVVMEIGCGVGNAVLPLLERRKTVRIDGSLKRLAVWGLDFSSVAIDLLKKDRRFVEAFEEGRARAAVWDITTSLPEEFVGRIDGVSDVTTLLFCLSAIHPDKMASAARHVASTLKPGGTLVFRDYGRYDEAQMKLGTSRRKKLAENFYVKSDGTRCYYFDLNDLQRLFGPEGASLEVIELKYLRRTYTNRGRNEKRRRVWVQGRFRKSVVAAA